MATRFVEVPEDVGDLISDVIKDIGQNPANYDLWYHDAPIWFIRRESFENDYKWVRRVQVSVFDVKDGPQLEVTPDIRVTARDGTTLALGNHLRRKLIKRESFRTVWGLFVAKGKDETRSLIKQLIEATWQDALKLTIQDLDTQEAQH